MFILGRKLRIQYYGATYLITHVGKSNVFIDDEDKLTFMSILGDVKELYDFKLLAYCIFEDKYYLFIKTHNIPISKVMHRVNMIYVKYFNQKYKFGGSIFQGRYKSRIIQDESGLLHMIKYIHSIPVYENLVSSIDEYKWSSDVFYRMNMESIVDIDYILDIFSIERYEAIEMYINLMNLIDGEFEISRGYYEDFNEEPYEHKKTTIGLDDILHKICNNSLDFDLIKQGSKKAYLMKYKEDYIKEGKELGFNNLDIGQNIGLSERAIRKYLLRTKG